MQRRHVRNEAACRHPYGRVPTTIWAPALSGEDPDMAGLGKNPVQGFATLPDLHWEFLRLWTGFELPSSWVNLLAMMEQSWQSRSAAPEQPHNGRLAEAARPEEARS
jgi:hypothetical protein